MDHVAPAPVAMRDVILLARAGTEFIPSGAEVTAIQPSQAPDYDVSLYLTAAGVMPRHRVVAPNFDVSTPAALPQFVLAVREPFPDSRYRLSRVLPEGRIYEVVR
jgi:hypothetical protein